MYYYHFANEIHEITIDDDDKVQMSSLFIATLKYAVDRLYISKLATVANEAALSLLVTSLHLQFPRSLVDPHGFSQTEIQLPLPLPLDMNMNRERTNPTTTQASRGV